VRNMCLSAIVVRNSHVKVIFIEKFARSCIHRVLWMAQNDSIIGSFFNYYFYLLSIIV
jgi:hypothetical protein